MGVKEYGKDGTGKEGTEKEGTGQEGTGGTVQESGGMWIREAREFCGQEDGVGVIEVVLILVVLIGLVIIFKSQITQLLQNIFKEINSQSKEVY